MVTISRSTFFKSILGLPIVCNPAYTQTTTKKHEAKITVWFYSRETDVMVREHKFYDCKLEAKIMYRNLSDLALKLSDKRLSRKNMSVLLEYL